MARKRGKALFYTSASSEPFYYFHRNVGYWLILRPFSVQSTPIPFPYLPRDIKRKDSPDGWIHIKSSYSSSVIHWPVNIFMTKRNPQFTAALLYHNPSRSHPFPWSNGIQELFRMMCFIRSGILWFGPICSKQCRSNYLLFYLLYSLSKEKKNDDGGRKCFFSSCWP